MANIHVLKNSENEAVIKVYETSNGSDTTHDISLENLLTTDKQEYVAGAISNGADESAGEFATYSGSHVTITGIWWGVKKDKQLNIVRLLSTGPDVTHGFMYLTHTGYHDYKSAGFADRIYAHKDIRLEFDGPGSCILRLTKAGWNPKIETAEFGIYDDETAVGS